MYKVFKGMLDAVFHDGKMEEAILQQALLSPGSFCTIIVILFEIFSYFGKNSAK